MVVFTKKPTTTTTIRVDRVRVSNQRSLKYQCWATNLLALGCCTVVYRIYYYNDDHQNHHHLAPLLQVVQVPVKPITALPPENNNNNNIPCQWIVLAGDSNIRAGYLRWAQLEEERNHSKVLQAQWKKKKPAAATDATTPAKNNGTMLPCDESTWRWVDREMVLLSTNAASKQKTCRIVTLKFLTNQDSEPRRLSNLLEHSSHYCPGYELDTTDTIAAGAGAGSFSRPAIPDSIYLSHGLWGLPNKGLNASGLDCAARFRPHLNILTHWMYDLNIVSITWQTLFPVNWHPLITNEYLAWDHQCQLDQVANKAKQQQQKQHGDDPLVWSEMILDMYNIVAPKKKELLVAGDSHFKNYNMLVGHFLSRCCGGWDRYWGNP